MLLSPHPASDTHKEALPASFPAPRFQNLLNSPETLTHSSEPPLLLAWEAGAPGSLPTSAANRLQAPFNLSRLASLSVTYLWLDFKTVQFHTNFIEK